MCQSMIHLHSSYRTDTQALFLIGEGTKKLKNHSVCPQAGNSQETGPLRQSACLSRLHSGRELPRQAVVEGRHSAATPDAGCSFILSVDKVRQFVRLFG